MTIRPFLSPPPAEKLHMEMGVSAPQTVAATLYDDFLPALRGRKAITTYREMASNDATVAAIMYAITMLVREVDWTVTPVDDTPEARVDADLLTSVIDGMAHPITDTVAEAVNDLVYGFSFHEIVWNQDLGWERFAHRPADTLLEWQLDDHMRPVGFKQATGRGGTTIIPVPWKGFLYRLDTSTPSGTSILRGAFRSWQLKKRAEEHLMIGMSRNLAGLPRIDMPSHVLAEGPGNTIYDTMKDVVTRVKRDEQMGILFPSDRDENGDRLYDFTLVSPDSDPHFDQAIGVVRMFAADIATTVLAQFIGLGRDAVGSRALAEPQQDLFRTALTTILDTFADQFHRQATARMFQLHDRPGLATWTHGPVRDIDVDAVSNMLLRSAQAGADVFTGAPDDPMLAQLLQAAGLRT